MNVALSVPEKDCIDWFDALAETTRVRAAEIPVAALTEGTETIEDAAYRGINLSFVRDVLSAEESRYFSDIPRPARHAVAQTLSGRLSHCCRIGARTASMRLGLERIREQDEETEIAARVEFLKRIVTPLDSYGLTLCLNVRYPLERPGSREWDLAINIVHDVMHPMLRMGVDVFPGELPGEFDAMTFVRNTGMNLGVIRFVYEPGLGETMTHGDLTSWNEALRWHGFRGGIVFCPRQRRHTTLADICFEVDRWAAAFETF